jgi:hypothetical protein
MMADRVEEGESAWRACKKPCRFLLERLHESEVTGIPVGVEVQCDSPLYRDIKVFQVLNNSAQRLAEKLLQFAHGINEDGECVDPYLMDEPVPNATVKHLANEIIRVLASQNNRMLAAVKETPQKDKGRFYTMTQEGVVRTHLAAQLGSLGDGQQGSQLMDWFMGKGKTT